MIIDVVLKKYNNHIHSTTKYSPNIRFYSENDKLNEEVLKNIKTSFKILGNTNINFNDNERCLLSTNFKIKKKFPF